MTALVLACNEITGDFSNVIALEYTGPTSPRVEEGDTVRLTARALDLKGDSIPDAPIVWAVLELDTAPVGISVDSVGLVTASRPGSWRVQGRIEELRTNPAVLVTVTGAPDSIAAVGLTTVTVDTGVVQSQGLIAVVYDLTTGEGQQLPLVGKTVVYELVDPLPGSAEASGVGLSLSSSSFGEETHRIEATTVGNGQTIVVARRLGTTQPDSITVNAIGLTARGDTVPGSPISFVVVFARP